MSWIYPLFEGYTQLSVRTAAQSVCWIYPLFEGYTQLFRCSLHRSNGWIYPLFEGYTQHLIGGLDVGMCSSVGILPRWAFSLHLQVDKLLPSSVNSCRGVLSLSME